MKKIDEKISVFLNNIINDWFALETIFESLYSGASLNAFCELKAEFDLAHENEEDY